MCGIAGIWGADDVDLVRSMAGDLVHRGPDDQGIYRADAGPGVLGHRRLSIMDVAGGRQPITVADGARAIVANGEIYNDPELRERLTPDHKFRTRSDSESALHLFEDLGPAAASKLDGMFCLAIADEEGLFLARDPIGIKPLYYGRRGDAFVFASELKALAGRADEVREFPAGSWYHSQRGFRRYYEVPEVEPIEAMTEDEAIRSVRSTLEAAVHKRLRSDVPLGAFLSGGLDSSLIAALAKRQLGTLHTFCVGIEGSPDLRAARRVADFLGTEHHEYVITVEEVLEELPRILYHLESFDQDLVRSGVPCYFTSRMAAEHVKVILTGEGADELFAGYTYYRDIDDHRALHDELRRSVTRLHNINLQRVDRLTMAHALEGRVPFLDIAMIEQAQRIPPRLKMRRRPDGRLVEKWVLRAAFEDLLPAEILWRDKAQFDEGSGMADTLGPALAGLMGAEEAARYAPRFPEARLRSAEECAYHRMLREVYSDSPVVLGNVARWDDGRPEARESAAEEAPAA